MKKIKLNRRAVAKELLRRLKANEQGARIIFEQAGIVLDDKRITLADCKQLQDMNPDKFVELMEFLYPDAVKVAQQMAANADDAADAVAPAKKDSVFSNVNWTNVIGSTLAGFGNGFLSQGTDSDTALAVQQAQYEAALAQQEADSKSKTLTIILIVVAVVVVAAVVLLAIKKK